MQNCIFFWILADLTYLIGFENGKSICNACGYKSDYQYSVKRHIEAKHMQLSYPCNYCSKVCNTKFNLLRHLRENHRELRWLWNIICLLLADFDDATSAAVEVFIRKDKDRLHCAACDYTTDNSSCIKRHIEARHLKRSYLCKYCPKVSNTRHNFLRHMSSKHKLQYWRNWNTK
mgnify:CR=1 FL=1